MMEQSPSTLDRPRLLQILNTLLDHAMPACAHVDYRLVGSAAALLAGVELPVGDVDLLVRRREDVDTFYAALAPFECLVAPTWLPQARQYYGARKVDGVEVEISTVEIETEVDAVETFGRGPWEHFVSIPCGPYTVSAVALELRLITELFRDRPDRYRPIIRTIREKGCDVDLVRRGLDAAGLPPAVRERVLAQLAGAPMD